MGLCLLMLAGGCAKKDLAGSANSTSGTSNTGTTSDSTATSGAATPTPGASTTTEIPKIEKYTAADYVTLGQYKGVEVTVTQLEVTDTDVDNKIQEDLKTNATQEKVTDRAVQSGDTVNIDYEGLIDGKTFDGGSAQGTDLEIGSGSFIPGFEDGLIGATIGQKVTLNLTFPTNYSADLAGKAVVFNVTINSISKAVLPELTEDYVKKNTSYDSIAAYKAGVRKDLEDSNKTTMDNEKAKNVMTKVIDSSTISSLPQTLLDYYDAQLRNQVEQQAAAYGMDIATYIYQNGMTQADYDSYIKGYSEAYAKRDLIITAVAQAEKMEATTDEYDKAITDYMSYYNVTTKDDLLKQITEDEIKDSVVMQKAYNYIIDNAVVTATAASN